MRWVSIQDRSSGNAAGYELTECLEIVVVGLGAKADGMVREDHFVITVASEIMAILCLGR